MNRRRSIWIDDAQYGRVIRAAALATMKEGRQVPVAEWIREAIAQRLDREAPDADRVGLTADEMITLARDKT